MVQRVLLSGERWFISLWEDEVHRVHDRKSRRPTLFCRSPFVCWKGLQLSNA